MVEYEYQCDHCGDIRILGYIAEAWRHIEPRDVDPAEGTYSCGMFKRVYDFSSGSGSSGEPFRPAKKATRGRQF